MKKFGVLAALIVISIASIFLLAGCGGGGTGGGGNNGISTVSGTLSSINRATITGGTVWAFGDPGNTATSLASGAYELNGVRSGWQTMRASVFVNGVEWVGSTAADVLSNAPTMNVNIVLSPKTAVTDIGGVVRDDNNNRIEGARVLFTTRIVYPAEQTTSGDGPYGSIVAVTNSNGNYLLKDVPIGVTGVISASKVAFNNREYQIDTVAGGDVVDFNLIPTNGTLKPFAPTLEAIESYTMPNTISALSVGKSTSTAYKMIRSYVSARYKSAIPGKSTIIKTQSTPNGSLMEIDLYFNAFKDNDSRDIAGYGIYRTTSPSIQFAAIDFIRDPYANFYGDMGFELTPLQIYYYAVTAVDVQFLDSNNNPAAGSESDKSNTLSITPIGQMTLVSPSDSLVVSGNPTFTWNTLTGSTKYRVMVFNQFPVTPITPVIDFTSNGGTSYTYDGLPLNSGNTYYWVILANDASGKAFSYSQIRRFSVN
ncbi:MAG: fibronectin type III domain-containing protein [Armatimonadota bacterium]